MCYMKSRKFWLLLQILGVALAWPMGGRASIPGIPGMYTVRFYPGDNLFGYQCTNTDMSLSNILQLGAAYHGSWISIYPSNSAVSVYNGTNGQWTPNWTLPLGQGARLHLVGSTFMNYTFIGIIGTNYWNDATGTALYVAHDPGPGFYLLSYPITLAASFQMIVGRAPAEGDSIVLHTRSTQVYTTNTYTAGAWTLGAPRNLNIGEAAYFKLQNRPPTNDVYAAWAIRNTPLVLAKGKVMKKAADPDGDALNIIAVTTSTNGATVTLDATNLTYTPQTDFFGMDQFSVIVSDGWGGFCTNTVLVSVSEVDPGPPAQWAEGNFTVTSFGVPGRVYTIEYKTNMSDPVWLWRTNALAASNPPWQGRIVFTEEAAGLGSRFYRTVYPARAGTYP
jgi:hypothetical protein